MKNDLEKHNLTATLRTKEEADARLTYLELLGNGQTFDEYTRFCNESDYDCIYGGDKLGVPINTTIEKRAADALALLRKYPQLNKIYLLSLPGKKLNLIEEWFDSIGLRSDKQEKAALQAKLARHGLALSRGADSLQLAIAHPLYDAIINAETNEITDIKNLLSSMPPADENIANKIFTIPASNIPFYKSEFKIANQFSLTPLMLASMLGKTEIVKQLLHAGADPNAEDINQQKAIDYAYWNQDIREILEPLTHDANKISEDKTHMQLPEENKSKKSATVFFKKYTRILSNLTKSQPLHNWPKHLLKNISLNYAMWTHKTQKEHYRTIKKISNLVYNLSKTIDDAAAENLIFKILIQTKNKDLLNYFITSTSYPKDIFPISNEKKEQIITIARICNNIISLQPSEPIDRNLFKFTLDRLSTDELTSIQKIISNNTSVKIDQGTFIINSIQTELEQRTKNTAQATTLENVSKYPTLFQVASDMIKNLINFIMPANQTEPPSTPSVSTSNQQQHTNKQNLINDLRHKSSESQKIQYLLKQFMNPGNQDLLNDCTHEESFRTINVEQSQKMFIITAALMCKNLQKIEQRIKDNLSDPLYNLSYADLKTLEHALKDDISKKYDDILGRITNELALCDNHTNIHGVIMPDINDLPLVNIMSNAINSFISRSVSFNNPTTHDPINQPIPTTQPSLTADKIKPEQSDMIPSQQHSIPQRIPQEQTKKTYLAPLS